MGLQYVTHTLDTLKTLHRDIHTYKNFDEYRNTELCGNIYKKLTNSCSQWFTNLPGT